MKLPHVLARLMVTLAVLFCTCHQVSARTVHVRGHYRSNGSYVMPYTRSSPGSTYFGGYCSPELPRYSPRFPSIDSYLPPPSVYVHGHYRSNGSYVRPHYRRR